ncbi:MAG: hypothetical protein KC476_00255, partial [Cyanobacteria bacterium HKST-UBA06]|nr:hypothetical protein [Cyanobacteria bacterium HKST-UBA06]
MAKSMALNGSVEASGRASNQNGGIINLASTGGAMVIAPTAVINAGGDRFDDNLTPGNGGTITMATKNGNMAIQGAVLANGSVGKNGGQITVNVDGNLTLQGNGRLHATSKLGNNSGNGGTVAIKANNITINAVNSNVSSIDVSSFNGNGGTVTLAAQQGITVNSSQTTLNKATIEASSFYGGKGGTVLIENNSLLHDIRFTKNGNDALVSANGGDLLSFFSAGSGGEMTLTSKRHIIFTNNSSDTTPTYLTAHGGRGVFGGGQGGSIKLHSAGQTTAQNSGSSNYDVKGGQGLLWGSGEDGTVEHE